jgi:hypothetical protein
MQHFGDILKSWCDLLTNVEEDDQNSQLANCEKRWPNLAPALIHFYNRLSRVWYLLARWKSLRDMFSCVLCSVIFSSCLRSVQGTGILCGYCQRSHKLSTSAAARPRGLSEEDTLQAAAIQLSPSQEPGLEGYLACRQRG